MGLESRRKNGYCVGQLIEHEIHESEDRDGREAHHLGIREGKEAALVQVGPPCGMS